MNTENGQNIQRPTLNALLAHQERLANLNNNGEEKSEDGNYTPTELKIMAEAKAMSLQEHLTELRKRLIISFASVILMACLAYYFSEDILALIIKPAGKLYYMRPTEAFFTYMKISLYAGLLASSPIIIYQIWAFIMPALTKGEKKISNFLVPVAIMLFWIGIIFSYYLVLPAAIKFFIGFATDELEPLFSIGQYLDFVVAFVLPFGLLFELPLIIMILANFNIVSSTMLRHNRKYFILLAFIIGAVVSPTPDMFSQTMMAMPMIILYEISYYIIRYTMNK